MFNNWRAQNMLARNATNEERKQVSRDIKRFSCMLMVPQVLHTFTAGSRGFNEQMYQAQTSPLYKPSEKKEEEEYAEVIYIPYSLHYNPNHALLGT